MSERQPLPRLGWLLLAGISLFWGTNWVALKVSLAEIPVWQYRAITCVAGGLGLLLMALFARQTLRVPRRIWGAMALGALFNVTGWHILIAYGVKLIASGQASVLAFTMPIWATILSAIFLREPVTLRLLAALALASAGVSALLAPSLEALGKAPIGMLLVLGAAVSWAAGTVVQKRVSWPIPVLAIAGWQLLLGSLPIVVVALLREPLVIQDASATALWALVYTLALPMLFCQYAWYKVVSLFPASIAAIGTVMVPVVGVLFGALVLGEPLGWREIAALLFVIAAISLVLVPPARAPAAPAAALRDAR